MAEITKKYIEQLDLSETSTQSSETIWANIHVIKNYLTLDIADISEALGQEATQELVKNAATQTTPEFLRGVLDAKVDSLRRTLVDADEEKKEKIQAHIDHLLLHTNILVTSINAHVEHLVTEKDSPLEDAIAQTIPKFMPKYPDRWPPETEEERKVMSNLDKNIAQRPEGYASDALLNADAAVCRHAFTVSQEVCEARGLQPYALQMRMQRDGVTTGHMLSIYFEGNDKSKPVFIDGQNAVTAKGFDAYQTMWAKYGWQITKAEATRLVSDESGQGWDIVNFLQF